MKKTIYVFLLLAGGWMPWKALAEIPEMALSLEQAESRTLKSSPRLQAKIFEVRACHDKADSQYGLLWPKLSLEASWRYVSEVPEINVPLQPRALSLRMADNTSYSIGPMLAWNIWDSGAVFHAWKAVESALQAKQQELDGLQRELTLKTRLAYFQTQMGQAQIDLLQESLQLAQFQYRDIQGQFKAGASSRMDLLSSHLEVLNRERLLSQARTDLTGSLRDLLSLTGSGEGLDLSRPAAARSREKIPEAKGSTPTVVIWLDPLEKSLARLEPASQGRLDANYPQLQTLVELAESSQAAAQALGSGHWPKIQVYGKTSLDYPNGPVLETIHQNTAGVNASWSIWEGNRVVKAVAEQDDQAQSLLQQKQQVLIDLQNTWQKALDRLAQLHSDRELNRKSAEETGELARLVYAAYRSGRTSYLDVQAANLKNLEARTQVVRTETQMLMQLALLDSLSESKEEKQP